MVSQTAGVINAGAVSISATGSVDLSGGWIVATSGTIGIDLPATWVRSGETIAAVNGATDIRFFGNVVQEASSYIGANGAVTVGGMLWEDGGLLLAVGDVVLRGLSQTAGTIEAANQLYVGYGTGTAGWAGSEANSGASFDQTGGTLAATGDINIFALGTLSQAGLIMAGGTVGATARDSITIDGTISASGTSGFMLLSNGGDVVLGTTGLLASPANVAVGNALQARPERSGSMAPSEASHSGWPGQSATSTWWVATQALIQQPRW